MIIVTGGAGFIGSNLIKGLNELGHDDILVVDNLANAAKHLNLNGVLVSDFLDKHDFLQALPDLKNIEAVFHQGACSSTTETDGEYMMRNNYQFSKTLLHYCVDNKIPFYYASSASVYGNGENGFAEKRECEYPLNVYAFSKFMFDHYVLRYLEKNTVDSPVIGLRYFNVYGYQENHKGSMASVIFHTFNQIKATGAMKLFRSHRPDFRDGEQKRDFIYVKDVVSICTFLGQSSISSGLYNVGTGTARTFYDLAANTFRALDQDVAISYMAPPIDIRDTYQYFTEADMQKLRSAGFQQPLHSLEDGIHDYVSSYLKSNDVW